MSRTTRFTAMLLSLFLLAAGSRLAPAIHAANHAQTDLNDLSMEVAALKAIHQLQLTPKQMKKLQAMAKETAQPPTDREPGEATDEFRQALTAFRDVLVEGTDDKKIDKADQAVKQLLELQEPAFDDEVGITEAARWRVPELLRLLSPRQVANFIALNVDDIHDPLEQIVNALDRAHVLLGQELEDLRNEVGDEVAKLVVGINARKAEQVSRKVGELFTKAHHMSDEEYREKKSELEKAAQSIVGELTATQAIDHVVEYALAEMLSNPRLAAALAARSK